MSVIEERSTDVVVVGAGVAGMRAALSLEPLHVALITKTSFGAGGSSPHAQGGIAAALSGRDSPRLHAADTMAAGAGLNDPQIVHLITERAPAAIGELLAVGTRFDRTDCGELALGREGGHRRHRIVHAGGDATGREMVRSLSRALARQPGVEIWERTFAEELVLENGRVVGLVADRGSRSGRIRFFARAVVLATGGAGQLYLYTTNPPELTGDGLAMAARAGAALVDLEFVQFHPTALAIPRDPLPLLTEALRGEGARLVDDESRRFLEELHGETELAPRDVVARAIFEHQQRGYRVFLDARHLGEAIVERFPTVYAACQDEGLDPIHEPIPVTPAAHYFMGGVMVDPHGRSSLPGLWACGEVSATGAHGANRLASNSLLEAVVFGSEAAADIRSSLRTSSSSADRKAGAAQSYCGEWTEPALPELRRRLRRIMWEDVGLVREGEGLERALEALAGLEAELPPAQSELRNLVVTGRCVALSALARRETRGSHVRTDHPASDPSLRRRLPLVLPAEARRSGRRAMSLEA